STKRVEALRRGDWVRTAAGRAARVACVWETRTPGGITLARVPANTPDYIPRVLGGGCMGVIAPGVASAAEAQAVVDAAKYAPIGARGVSGALPVTGLRPIPELYAKVNAVKTVIVMFDSGAALNAADDIAAVDGVDIVMIGTNDLLAELGLPAGNFDNLAIKDAYQRTINACSKHGKHVGVGGFASRPDLIAEFVEMGARDVSSGTDLNFLLAAAREKAAAVAKFEL
ncbi:MAG: aldolase/citrate lyase family protein, partial [Pseudomonadota bacterium]|nr:aldolase/citrate lyase family protein [Pseudomonadota bacterium]